MLDNLGFSEILFLGLLLFLFLGPDRLPELGARVGRWVSNLTRYSGSFMNEWRDEVLAMHDAMEQVQGIRDEIAAAQAEIASALHETRDDLGGAVQGARQDVEQQLQRATRFVPEEQLAGIAAVTEGGSPSAPQAASAQASRPVTAAHSEGAAVDKTQQVVDQLLAKRAAASRLPRDAPQAPPEHVPSSLSVQPSPSPAELARLRDQVRDLGAEMEELRTVAAEMRAVLQAQQEARAPVVAGKAA
jgi:Sec-independent protein translocase protein TatA